MLDLQKVLFKFDLWVENEFRTFLEDYLNENDEPYEDCYGFVWTEDDITEADISEWYYDNKLDSTRELIETLYLNIETNKNKKIQSQDYCYEYQHNTVRLCSSYTGDDIELVIYNTKSCNWFWFNINVLEDVHEYTSGEKLPNVEVTLKEITDFTID